MAYDDSMFVPPWHEWSDDFVGAEKWDRFNNRGDAFEHPGGHERLPEGIAQLAKVWRRPNEVFNGTDGLVVRSEEDEDDVHDLLTVNESLIDVKIYRRILYHIVLYSSRFKNEWHPSNLVFSRDGKTKASWRNVLSTPEYNSCGKYWLKLFFMGKFRMMCVSDHLPLDGDGRVLLPLCENNKVLWLPLLVKGLLRVHALADEFEQFSTITCLTGWSCIRTDCQRVLRDDLWQSILSHSSDSVTNTDGGGGKWRNENPPKNFAKCFPMKTDRGTDCYYDQIDSDDDTTNPPNDSIVTVITLSPTIYKKKKPVTNQYSQPVFLNYVKLEKNKSIEPWKTHRWAKWAIENDVIKQHELGEFMKLINIYAPCADALKKPCPLMKVLNKYNSQDKNDAQYELDFLYLEPFITRIEFYVKSSSRMFPISRLIFVRDEDGPPNSDPTNNADTCPSLYLHFESANCESALFTLSVCADYAIRDGRVVVTDAPSSRNAVDYPYVNVEQFLWYETKLPTPLTSIRTRGVSNDVVKLQPGINVLRVWGELPAKYSLTVESTVDFSTHRTARTVYRTLADSRPTSLTHFLAPVRETFLQLCDAKPGTGSHGRHLMKFYASLMPPCVGRESELKKIERYSTVSKCVQSAVAEWVEKKFQNDLPGATKIFAELQELFQNNSFGQKEIFDLAAKIKLRRELLEAALNQNKNETAVETPAPATMSGKKSTFKSKSRANVGKTPPPTPTEPEPMLMKMIHLNMFEIVCNVLNADEIDLDEYYLRNDLLNYLVYIGYDESNSQFDDPLLMFQLELNTHSESELAPTIVQFSNQNKHDRAPNLMFIDNDSRLEIKPTNIDMTLFAVKRNIKGYTLLGWRSDKKPNDERDSYKLTFFGRPYQILHPCSTRNDTFYEYSTTTCDNLRVSNFVSKLVKNSFYKPNVQHILARVFLKVQNASLFTIYCHLERLESAHVEIRVADQNCTSTVFASSRTRGKTALIPAVYLDPNYNKTKTSAFIDSSENLINTTFVIEVVLIKNFEINYTNDGQAEIGDYDWTISCAYDQTLTDITLETDAAGNYFKFFNSTLYQTAAEPSLELESLSHSKIDDNIDNNNSSQPTLSHQKVLESMLLTQDMCKEKFDNNYDHTAELYTSRRERENILKRLIDERFEIQSATTDAIGKISDLFVENRQAFMNDLNYQILDFLKLPQKSSIGMKKSRMSKKKLV